MPPTAAVRSLLAATALAGSLFLATTALAVDAAAVVGVWKVAMELQGQRVEATLEIREAEEGLTGTWTGPRGSSELSNVHFDGKQLSFERQLERQGQTIVLHTTATVDGRRMDGKISTPRGESPFSGEREE